MKTLLTLVLSLCLSLPVLSAELSLEQLTTQLSAPSELRAHFSQERTLTGFARSLKAEGTLLVSRAHGILWRQSTPFAQDVVLDERGILVNDGTGLKAMAQSDNPQLQSFAQMLKSLFAGDLSALEQFFTLELTGTAEQWQLVLTPTQEPMSLIFTGIELKGGLLQGGQLKDGQLKDGQLKGGQFVQAVVLKDKAGDRTKISFSQLDSRVQPLTSDEEQLFDH